MRSPVLDKSIEIIYRELKGIISETDFTEYSAAKSESDKLTRTFFRTFTGEKISRLVIEQYTINSKAWGVVLNIYPKPEFGIPIFTFQLGGQIPEKVIFVVDIIPVIRHATDHGISELYHKHASGSDNLGSSKDWIHQICSENALICQYKPFEPEKILNALTDYLCFWRDIYYLQDSGGISGEAEKEVREGILKFKSILHANDAGLEIYLKKFGKEMTSVIEQAAFGSEPPLPQLEETGQAEQDAPGSDLVSNDQLLWSEDAEQYLLDAPKFVRSKIRSNAEEKAMASGIKTITRDFIENLRK